MLKMSHAGCLRLSLVISAQFTLETCIAAKNCEKFTIFGVQGAQGHRCCYPWKACQQCL